jgi:heme-degrading monooxygenase HmoA
VIARIWTAKTTRAQAPAYAEYLRTHVFGTLREIDGYERALLLQRTLGDEAEVQVITFWRSLDAIRAFAGADVENAVVTDAAAALLTSFDRRTRHFDVVLDEFRISNRNQNP